MNYKRVMAIIYTFLHFLVDFTTVFLISGILLGPVVGVVNRAEVIIVYNLIAFAGQLPIGMIVDVLNRNRLVVIVGCALAVISYPLSLVSPWGACVFAAIGNAAFHIGAGSDILKMSMPKAGLPGLFVSSGALGVWLAYKASVGFAVWLCPFLMLISIALLVAINKKFKSEEANAYIRYNKPNLLVFFAISCFMFTIVIRSLLGMLMDFSWKSTAVFSFLSVVAVVGGKAIGGYMGDRFGYIKTATISLGIALVLFVFSMNYWLAGIVAILCFNMTMPLTLTAIASVCDKKYGFAFGLTTFALAVGFLPIVFGANKLFGIHIFTIGVFISLILMICGYIMLKKTVNNRR